MVMNCGVCLCCICVCVSVRGINLYRNHCVQYYIVGRKEMIVQLARLLHVHICIEA